MDEQNTNDPVVNTDGVEQEAPATPVEGEEAVVTETPAEGGEEAAA